MNPPEPALPTAQDALPGRETPLPVDAPHFVSGASITPPFPDSSERFLAGMGCFWGAERKFWEVPGVHVTAVGYAGGITPNPTYEEVCSGHTGHAEVVLAVFDPAQVDYAALLDVFWQAHDPTQGMRQGNDLGTQYRSALYVFNDRQRRLAVASRNAYQEALRAAGYGPITTEIAPASTFYYAERHHQQYLAKVPNGYCGLGGTGVACPATPRRQEAPAAI